MKAQFTNLYIKNIDPEVTDEEFEALFKEQGNVTSSVIQRDEEGRSRGFGFVNYETHEEAQKAVDNLNDKEFHGRKLFVSRAQKKAEREEELRKAHEQARLEILKIHSQPVNKHGDIDYEAIVKLSDGFNGADLRNVVTEAGMFAIRDDR